MDTLLVGPELLRQIFNDTEADALWLVAGAPPEFANTLEMTPETIATMYPHGMRALPPELGGGEFVPPAGGLSALQAPPPARRPRREAAKVRDSCSDFPIRSRAASSTSTAC